MAWSDLHSFKEFQGCIRAIKMLHSMCARQFGVVDPVQERLAECGFWMASDRYDAQVSVSLSLQWGAHGRMMRGWSIDRWLLLPWWVPPARRESHRGVFAGRLPSPPLWWSSDCSRRAAPRPGTPGRQPPGTPPPPQTQPAPSSVSSWQRAQSPQPPPPC